MKIEIEIPDWAQERAIYIMAGIELAAYKIPGKKWKVKTSRCNMCGKCCMNLDPKKHPFPVINGRCVYLLKRPGKEEKYECGLRISRPFRCCVGTTKVVPECTEKFEER